MSPFLSLVVAATFAFPADVLFDLQRPQAGLRVMVNDTESPRVRSEVAASLVASEQPVVVVIVAKTRNDALRAMEKGGADVGYRAWRNGLERGKAAGHCAPLLYAIVVPRIQTRQ